MTDRDHMPLVSVIMPTYNHAVYIGEAIQSILGQTYENLELIIVDNYSTDNTNDVISSFQDERIKVYRYQNNGIIASARNYAVSKSKGNLLAFIDSDDIWAHDKLEIQLSHFSDNASCCVSTNFTPIGDVVYCRKYMSFRPGEAYRDYSYKDIALMNPIMTSSVLVKKSSFLEAGAFDENPDFSFIEDWELWLRISRIKKVRVLSKPLIQYRITKKKDGMHGT